MQKQITKTSEGCPYGCSFCFNGKNKFKEYHIPEIKSNNVILHDDAFLSRKDILEDIKALGNIKIDGKVVYYELTQGINLHDLTLDIAKALKQARFKNIRFAWDDSYTKKSFYRVYDGIRLLEKAGYKREDMMCFILSNYYVSLRECMLKAKSMLYEHIIVCNCRYRKNLYNPKIYPEHWTMNEIEYFKQECRINNQFVMRKGYDPEITKRLVRAVTLPSATHWGTELSYNSTPNGR